MDCNDALLSVSFLNSFHHRSIHPSYSSGWQLISCLCDLKFDKILWVQISWQSEVNHVLHSLLWKVWMLIRGWRTQMYVNSVLWIKFKKKRNLFYNLSFNVLIPYCLFSGFVSCLFSFSCCPFPRAFCQPGMGCAF